MTSTSSGSRCASSSVPRRRSPSRSCPPARPGWRTDSWLMFRPTQRGGFANASRRRVAHSSACRASNCIPPARRGSAWAPGSERAGIRTRSRFPLACKPEFVFLPHGNDPNLAHQRTFAIVAECLAHRAPLGHDVAQPGPQDGRDARGRVRRLRRRGRGVEADASAYHASQQSRNLRTRGRGSTSGSFAATRRSRAPRDARAPSPRRSNCARHGICFLRRHAQVRGEARSISAGFRCMTESA